MRQTFQLMCCARLRASPTLRMSACSPQRPRVGHSLQSPRQHRARTELETLMDAVPAAESLGVTEVIRSMTDSEVRDLVDEAYDSGLK